MLGNAVTRTVLILPRSVLPLAIPCLARAKERFYDHNTRKYYEVRIMLLKWNEESSNRLSRSRKRPESYQLPIDTKWSDS